MFWRLAGGVKKLKRELKMYRLVLVHRRTPWLARILLGLAVAYFVSPIDLIPDVIPVIGYLDDALLVPALIFIALKFVPKDVIEECRQAASRG